MRKGVGWYPARVDDLGIQEGEHVGLRLAGKADRGLAEQEQRDHVALEVRQVPRHVSIAPKPTEGVAREVRTADVILPLRRHRPRMRECVGALGTALVGFADRRLGDQDAERDPGGENENGAVES